MHIFLLASDIAICITNILVWGTFSLFVLYTIWHLRSTRSKEKDDIPDDI